MYSLTARQISFAGLFTALIAMSALVTIPVGPVPFTLQVLFVMLAGLVLGPRLGALSVLAYLALGLVAPVYAGGTSGLGVLVGPTGGYLWGFVLAALLTGVIARRPSASLGVLVAAGLLGLVPIYGLGATWLALQLEAPSYEAVVIGGVLRFLPVDVIKALAAGFAARSLLSLPLGLPELLRGR